jgi:hypothetical protein
MTSGGAIVKAATYAADALKAADKAADTIRTTENMPITPLAPRALRIVTLASFAPLAFYPLSTTTP